MIIISYLGGNHKMEYEYIRKKREELIRKDLEKQGFKVEKTDRVYKKGTPDFVCKTDSYELFVESKHYRDKLLPTQIEVISELLSRRIEVWIAQITKEDAIEYIKFKTIKQFGTYLNPPKKMKLKCKICKYEWVPRIETKPKECPDCKSRNWDKNA